MKQPFSEPNFKFSKDPTVQAETVSNSAPTKDSPKKEAYQTLEYKAINLPEQQDTLTL